MKVTIKATIVKVEDINGTYFGEYYYKNDKMYLQSSSRHHLAMLMKYKNEIAEELKWQY